MRSILLVGLIGIGCASSDGQPSSCDHVAQRSGTYLEHWAARSGTCGAIPDSIQRLDANTMLAAGCVVDNPVWSENGCRSDVSITCPTGSGSIKQTGYTRQTTADGSQIVGTISVVVTGMDACVGLYDVTLTRQ